MLNKLKFAVLLPAVALAVTQQVALAQKSSKPTRPNVIIIYSDDQGAADLNIYGSKDLYTPHLDGLARQGTRFTQFYSAAPICSPSRASLLTGRYPQRAQLAANGPESFGEEGMPASQFTMAELFKQNGYKTAHIGKWHLGYSVPTMPNGQGFDYSFGFMGGCIDNYSHYYYWGGPNRHDLWRNGTEIYEPGKYFADMMLDEAGKFMEQNKQNPFYMYFAINIPHYPLQPETKWLEYYKNLPMPRKIYAAYISTLDEKVGALLKKLDELGMADNTIVIFQADQGFSKEDRGFGGGGNAGPYRGSKFSVFEGGIRVPAFIRWPGHVPVNEVRNQLATNIDWFPTLAEYCSLSLPGRKIDGKSIAKVIASAKAPSPHPEFYWQSSGGKNNPQWAMRNGKWKLLHSPYEAKQGDLNEEKLMLIDMSTDSAELHNVAAQHPDVVQKLQKKYQAWIGEVYNQ